MNASCQSKGTLYWPLRLVFVWYSVRPTMVSLVTDTDHSASTVTMTTTQPWARLPNVHVVHPPAVTLANTLLLDPTELCGTAGEG